MTRGLGNLIGMTLAVATAGTAMAQTPVTVTILRFVQGQDPDPVQVADAISGPDTIGDGDYYARVRIGSASPRRNRSDFIELRDFQPFWTFTDIVDADDGVIPVVIQMWDADPIENNDDIIDLNPTDGSQELVLNLDLATCEWTGDAGASDDPNATGRFSRGDGDGEHFGAAEGGERGTILFDVACSRNGDIDDDGIPDGVERLGIVDTDGNLVQDLRGLADPCRKTLLVENDFMAGAADGHTHQPSPVALAELVAAFDGAGLLVDTLSPSACPYAGFPTQTGGIGLVMLMDDAISEQAQVPIGNLDQIRNTNFDPALRPYVHYALWAHNITRNGTVMDRAGAAPETARTSSSASAISAAAMQPETRRTGPTATSRGPSCMNSAMRSGSSTGVPMGWTSTPTAIRSTPTTTATATGATASRTTSA